MSYFHLVEKVKTFEKENDVSKLIYQGHNIWHLVKSEIQLNFREKQTTPSTPKANFLKRQYFKWKLSKVNSEFLFPKLNETDVLLISENNAYIENIGTNCYHRHLDPIIEKFPQKYSTLKMYPNSQTNNEEQNWVSLDFKRFESYVWLKTEVLLSEKIEGVKKVASFFDLDLLKLKRRIISSFIWAEIWTEIIKRTKPKTIMAVCYYSRIIYPALIASKISDVKFVDIQHGKQGEGHICYSNLGNESIKNPILPSAFWNWNEYSSKNISASLSSKWKIQTIVGGGLWESFYRDKRIESSGLLSLKKKVKSFEKSVLLGTQPVEDGFFDSWVLDGIKENQDILFLIRLHPFQSQNEIPGLVNIKQVANVEIDLSTSLPFIDVLDLSDIVISKWSSICFESMINGKISAIIHPTGKKAFEELINMGVVNYCQTFEEILNLLKEKQENRSLENFDYNKSDNEISSALKLVLND